MAKYEFKKKYDLKVGNNLIKSFNKGDVIDGERKDTSFGGVAGNIFTISNIETVINGVKYQIPMQDGIGWGNIILMDYVVNEYHLPNHPLPLESENTTTTNTVKSSKIKDFFAKKETKIGLVVLALGITVFGLIKYKVIKIKK